MAAAGGPGPTCVLGIDLGTTSVKAALVTGTERGLALAQSCSRETQAYSDSLGAAPQVRLAGSAQGHPRPCLAVVGVVWYIGQNPVAFLHCFWQHVSGYQKAELNHPPVTVQGSQAELLNLRRTQVLKNCLRHSKTILP